MSNQNDMLIGVGDFRRLNAHVTTSEPASE